MKPRSPITRLCALGALGLQGFPLAASNADAADFDLKVGAYLGASFGGEGTRLLYGVNSSMRIAGSRNCTPDASGYGRLDVRLGASDAFEPELGVELGGGFLSKDRAVAVGPLAGFTLHFKRGEMARAWAGLQGGVHGADVTALLGLGGDRAQLRTGINFEAWAAQMACQNIIGGDLVVDGRPLRIGGEKAPLPFAHTNGHDDPEARHWIRAAQTEWTSVATFMVVREQLRSLGAPQALIARYSTAAEDEYYHTLGAGALVCAAGIDSLSLGSPLTGEPDFQGDLSAIATEAFWDGCVGERLAAQLAFDRTHSAQSSAEADYLKLVAQEEESHAELAWDTVKWVLGTGDRMSRQLLTDALDIEPENNLDAAASERFKLIMTRAKARLGTMLV